jgi:hypothetical protein
MGMVTGSASCEYRVGDSIDNTADAMMESATYLSHGVDDVVDSRASNVFWYNWSALLFWSQYRRCGQ